MREGEIMQKVTDDFLEFIAISCICRNLISSVKKKIYSHHVRKHSRDRQRLEIK